LVTVQEKREDRFFQRPSGAANMIFAPLSIDIGCNIYQHSFVLINIILAREVRNVTSPRKTASGVVPGKRFRTPPPFSTLAAFVLVLTLQCMAANPAVSDEPARILLAENWRIQSSCDVKASGAEISVPGFSVDGWHIARVPTTVVAALVSDGTYPNPYFGLNLKSLPGMDYSSKSFFANEAMPPDSPFRCSWWFRTEFNLSAMASGHVTWLHFDGINYRANIWLNGQKVGDAKDVRGMMRLFELDVSKFMAAGKLNSLAVEVFPPEETDLAMTWVDWNPTPPDKDMGLWKDVFLTESGMVSLRHPFVATKLDAEYRTAALTISADLHNSEARESKATVLAQIEGIRVSQTVTLAASETKKVVFTPDQFPQLRLTHPRLWWPYQMGKPEMYTAQLWVETAQQVSDSTTAQFGIREVTSRLTDKGYRLFTINGRKLLVRGAAWAPDMLLRWSPERTQAAMDYVRGMNLNAIRLEGRMERDEFFDLADRTGILVMPGWTCCDFWEKWSKWTEDTDRIAQASLTDQAVRLRNHPSVFVFLYGSDNPPSAKVEKMYLQAFKDVDWPNPTVSSASGQKTKVTGASGVKMTGPYDYVPPNFWLTNTKGGGAFGYNTETSPGPVIPTLPSLKKFIPADHLWPIDEYWNYHAGLERFTTIERFTTGLENRYGKAAGLEDFLRKSQAMNYEAERAMFEAYGRNKYESTGVIQWMLNNAWPSLIWNLYDYYLVPSGAYFGSKKACEPVHIQYSYDDNSVAVLNSHDFALAGARVKATIYDINAGEKATQSATVDIPADGSIRAFELKSVPNLSATYFLKLELRNSAGEPLSDNFYWLSTRPDVLDYAKKLEDVYVPEKAYADLTGLNTLPPVKVTSHSSISTVGRERVIRISIENPAASLAFMVHVRIADARTGDDVVPIFWDDNYVSLLPGEKRELQARFDSEKSNGIDLNISVDGWNVASSSTFLESK